MGNKSSFNINTREPSPCDGCTERFKACWCRCPKDERGEYGYNAWKAEVDRVKEERRKYQRLAKTRRWSYVKK